MIRVPKENKLMTYVYPFRVSMSIFLDSYNIKSLCLLKLNTLIQVGHG